MNIKLAALDPLTSTPLPVAGPRFPEDGAKACEFVAKLLGEFADGVLPELEQVGVDHHLSVCPACRESADEYFDVIYLAQSLPPIAPPPAAEARILAALRAAG